MWCGVVVVWGKGRGRLKRRGKENGRGGRGNGFRRRYGEGLRSRCMLAVRGSLREWFLGSGSGRLCLHGAVLAFGERDALWLSTIAAV